MDINGNTYKCEIELVPQPLWYANLRKVATKAEWDTIRKATYKKYNHHCAFCGTDGMMHCHEIWRYEDTANPTHGIQTLTGFVALCPMCHHIKHIGLAGILARRGVLKMDDVVQHFCRVNDCTPVAYENHRMAAFTQWEVRNLMTWTTDLQEWSYLAEGKDLTPRDPSEIPDEML